MLLFLSWVWAFNKWHALRDEVNTAFGIPMPSKEIIFVAALKNDMDHRIDNLPTIISFICGFTWMVLLAALTRTALFGPLIAMIMRMIKDIMQFLVIYII